MPIAIVYYPTGDVKIENLKDLGDYQKIVGGRIQMYPMKKKLDFISENYCAIVNEEGVMKQLQRNYGAEWILASLGFYVNFVMGACGPVIFLQESEAGDSRALSPKLKNAILHLCDKIKENDWFLEESDDESDDDEKKIPRNEIYDKDPQVNKGVICLKEFYLSPKKKQKI